MPATPPLLTTRALNRATLARQMLLAPARVPLVTAIERLAGLQAQLARPPFVGLWSRVAGFRREDLVSAIEHREVVRATLMRGTIHLVSRGDYATFRPAVQPALTASNQSILRDRAKGIDVEALVAAAREVFGVAPCTFAKLRTRLSERFAGLDERAMGYIVRMQLPLVQVPEAGAPWAYRGTADFALADAWLGEPIPTAGSADELALRYFAAFGPASTKDLQTWSGLPVVNPIVQRLRPRLRVFRDEHGRELFDLPKAPRPAEDETAPVTFLPEYDNLLLGHADRTRVVADAHRKAMARKNLVLPATVLVDGVVAATWSIETKKRTATLSVVPFVKLARSDRLAIEAHGARLIDFAEPDAVHRSVTLASPRS